MGYRGKLAQRERARELRADGWTMPDIAVELGVSRSSVSLWTKDVEFSPRPRRQAGPYRRRGPNLLQLRKAAFIEAAEREGVTRLGVLNEQAALAAGAALYAGEGAKRDGEVAFANSDPQMVAFFCAWLRRFFAIDESRLRVVVYLHQGLDLDAAEEHWSAVTGVPRSQFTAPYRAVPDAGIRHNKHEFGCVRVRYSCSTTHRTIMGLVRALLSSLSPSGVAQSAAQRTVNATVLGSSPSPGASKSDVENPPTGP